MRKKVLRWEFFFYLSVTPSLNVNPFYLKKLKKSSRDKMVFHALNLKGILDPNVVKDTQRFSVFLWDRGRRKIRCAEGNKEGVKLSKRSV